MAFCKRCGYGVEAAKAFCPGCGGQMAPQPLETVVVPQVAHPLVVSASLPVASRPQQPLPAAMFCPACGNQIVHTAAICPSCGTVVGTPKDKTVAVLLAVFLFAWTWVYTYKRDAVKFWIGGVLGLIGLATSWLVVGFFLMLGVWIWAVIDTAVKPTTYYQRFPRG